MKRARRGKGGPEEERRECEDAAEILVSYDKRDNGLSNYPAERLNRATMKFVLSVSRARPRVHAFGRARNATIYVWVLLKQ